MKKSKFSEEQLVLTLPDGEVSADGKRSQSCDDCCFHILLLRIQSPMNI
jgi:hypothetical protein